MPKKQRKAAAPLDASQLEAEYLSKLKERLKDVPEDLLEAVVRDWLERNPAESTVSTRPEVVQELVERAQLRVEEASIRARLAAKLGHSFDDLGKIVSDRFEGATKEIAERHFDAVRQERTRRITRAVLDALGGEGATLDKILLGAGQAVTTPLGSFKPTAKDAAVIGQVAQAVSQAVQQVAINVQKIVTVALESERSAAATHPKYYDP